MHVGGVALLAHRVGPDTFRRPFSTALTMTVTHMATDWENDAKKDIITAPFVFTLARRHAPGQKNQLRYVEDPHCCASSIATMWFRQVATAWVSAATLLGGCQDVGWLARSQRMSWFDRGCHMYIYGIWCHIWCLTVLPSQDPAGW